MTTIYIDRPDQTVLAIARAAFPGYSGRKYKLSTDVPRRIDSYWDGGSKDEWCFVQLSTMKAAGVPDNHPAFQPGAPRDLDALPPGIVLVCHSILLGKDAGITIYANASELAPLLPAAPADLTDDEKAVLYCTRAYKASYNGCSNYRQRESGLPVARWEAAKAACQAKGLLDKRGAITAAGRNAAPARWDRAA